MQVWCPQETHGSGVVGNYIVELHVIKPAYGMPNLTSAYIRDSKKYLKKSTLAFKGG
jgi:hypothetical protein